MTGAWRFLPPLALITALLLVGAVVAVSGDTFGYDFAAYWLAARRLLDGEALYDPAVQAAVGYGVFLYPPPAAAAFIPFALVPQDAAAIAWVALVAVATLAGIALMPVPSRIRWLVLLLAGVMWPTSYAIKLGQVTPVLFLAFVVAWRWLDRPLAVGAAGGLGAVLKLQPALLLGWAALTGRWRAVAAGAGLAGAAVLLALPLTGIAAYADYVELVRRVSGGVDTPNNLSPGAIAYGLGVDAQAAGILQVAVIVLTLALVVLTARRANPAASILVAITATQLASPVLWTHYAMILLLPIAWLLERRQWWTAVIPLLMSLPLVGIAPPAIYPAAFGVVIVAVAWAGSRQRSTP